LKLSLAFKYNYLANSLSAFFAHISPHLSPVIPRHFAPIRTNPAHAFLSVRNGKFPANPNRSPNSKKLYPQPSHQHTAVLKLRLIAPSAK